MEKLPRRMYTKEFKEEAAQLMLVGGLGLTDAARRLSISVKTLANWVAAAKHGVKVKSGVCPNVEPGVVQAARFY